MPTNIYDVTFPPDTQLANLLGSDLRNFRLDTQQRMALISGTLATRWNPGTDAQPLNWTGLLYFATDTNQVFQWSGAAWVDVSSGIGGQIKDYDDYSSKVFAAAAPGTIRTITVPIGSVQNVNPVGSFIEIDTTFNWTSSTGATPVYTLSVNGNAILSFTMNLGLQYIHAEIAISSLLAPRALAWVTPPTGLVVPIQRTAVLAGTYDGTAAITISDAFSAATTITATCDYMHVRIRK